MTKRAPGIFKISAVYGLTSLFLRAANFFLLPLFTHLIPSGEFGIYSMFAAAAVIFSAFFSSGFQSALTKFYIAENDADKKKEVFSFIFTITLLLSLIGLAVSLIWAGPVSVLISGEGKHEMLVRAFGCIMMLDSLSAIALQLLKTREEVKKTAAFSVLGGTANIVLTVLLLTVFGMGINALVYAQLFSSGITLLLLGPSVFAEIKRFRFSLFFLPVFLFVYPLIFSSLFGTLSDFADRFILNSFLGPEKVGVYSFTYRIALVMNVFVISFRMAWSPRSLTDLKLEDSAAHFGRIFTKLLAVGLAIMTVTVVIYPYLFSASINGFEICKANYQTSRTVLIFIMAGYFFTGLMSFYSVYPMQSGRTMHFLFSDALACIINIGLNYLLIPIWNLEGAAAATMIGYAAGAVYLFAVSRKRIAVAYNRHEVIHYSLALTAIPIMLALTKNIIIDAVVTISLLFTLFAFRKSIRFGQ